MKRIIINFGIVLSKTRYVLFFIALSSIGSWSCNDEAPEKIIPGIVLTTPADSAPTIDLNSSEEVTFSWAVFDGSVAGGYMLYLSKSADLSSPKTYITSELSIKVPSGKLDTVLEEWGYASEAEADIYWTVKPTETQIATLPDPRLLKLKRLAKDTVEQTDVQKVRDIIIYDDPQFYSCFPSIIKGGENEFLLAFRRAPDRKIFGEPGSNHVDPNSYLVMLRSADGENWIQKPKLMYAHPFGGSQDPCLLRLRDGTLVCSSYAWAFVLPSGVPNLKPPYHMADGRAYFLGGYVIRSLNNGITWRGPYYPPNISSEVHYSALGNPLPAYNRGAMYEEEDGRILWVAAANHSQSPRRISAHLLISGDKGLTWNYSCPVAVDNMYSFSETSLVKTPKGDLVAFLRTTDMGDDACIARSTDGGKSFQQWQRMGFRGHPLHALQLPDNKVLLTYGYRHAPYGIRARILNPECTDFSSAPEIILREDGGTTDIGYPWSVQLDEKRVLIVYYFNVANGTRHIAGTIIEITVEKTVSIKK